MPACVHARSTPTQHRASPDAHRTRLSLARATQISHVMLRVPTLVTPNPNQISHVMLRTDPAALGQRTKGECNELD